MEQTGHLTRFTVLVSQFRSSEYFGKKNLNEEKKKKKKKVNHKQCKTNYV